MPRRYEQRANNWVEQSHLKIQNKISDLLESKTLSPLEVARIKGDLEHKLAAESDEYRNYHKFVEEYQNEQHRKHPRFSEWLAESNAAWNDAAAPIPSLFKDWLSAKEHAATQKTDILITDGVVVTFEHQINANVQLIQEKLTALIAQKVDLASYEKILDIRITKIDKKPDEPIKRFGFIDV